MMLLDSSALIEMLHRTPKGRAIIDFIRGEPVALPPFVAFELLGGDQEGEAESRLVSSLPPVPFTVAQSVGAARIRRALRQHGITIGDVDIFIASMALSGGDTVVTCDRDFEKVPGLSVKVF